MSKPESEMVSFCERVLAILLTLAAIGLHLMRLRHAGPLWRDEVAVLNLSQLSWPEIAVNFPHEAFPLLFFAVVKAYVFVAGAGVLALRIFGLLIGLTMLGVLWLNARLTGRELPLFGLALFAFDPMFFVWGDSLRGYGLGAALLALAFGLTARAIREPNWKVLSALAVTAIAGVHVLLANSVLLFALLISAAAVLSLRR